MQTKLGRLRASPGRQLAAETRDSECDCSSVRPGRLWNQLQLVKRCHQHIGLVECCITLKAQFFATMLVRFATAFGRTARP